MKKTKKKAWGGRFAQASSSLLESFNASLPFDKILYAEDILGSKAHARMLNRIGVLTKEEHQKIDQGLSDIEREIEKGEFTWSDDLEDIHMAIETRLIAKIGPLGGKLHTARSRNDQVALDLRLFCIRQMECLMHAIQALQRSMLGQAEQGFIPMPGYTHLQRAQPVYWAHHWLAYIEMLERDKDRLKDTMRRTKVSPLGSGALAGSTFDIDREGVAQELGLNGVSHNSLDAVSDRDFAAELLFDLSLVMTHLSRLSEELILWSSQEFGFILLPQEFCTGSSMMPQKVNPDVPELIRGKTGRVYGNLMAILTLLKGLPLAYNKDLQEDKVPLFDSINTVQSSLEILAVMIPSMKTQGLAMKRATEDGFMLATDLADYLAERGIPFRKAHEIVGRIVRHCIKKQTTLEKLGLKDLKRFSPAFGPDVKESLSVERSINRRRSIGGTARVQVVAEIERVKKVLK